MTRAGAATASTVEDELVFGRPLTMTQNSTHYCPGCGHGIVHRLVAETIDELGIRERTIGIGSVGCSVLIYNYLDMDFVEALHGRAPAVATGLKRVMPDRIVFTYQGDGDLAAIGTAEIIHAAARGENMTVIFVNNAIYGMTGGQMAPTTLPDQRSTSTLQGRDPTKSGMPIRVAELLTSLDGPVYIARTAIDTPANVGRAKMAIRKAFRIQQAKLGFSLVEVLSPCPVNWDLKPKDALTWLTQKMVPYYPLGEFKVAQSVAAIEG